MVDLSTETPKAFARDLARGIVNESQSGLWGFRSPKISADQLYSAVASGLREREGNTLSEAQLHGLASTVSHNALNQGKNGGFLRKSFMFAATAGAAFAVDQVVFNGLGTKFLGDQITNMTGFQAPADMAERISDGARGALSSIFKNTSSVVMDAGVALGETFGIEAGYGKAIAAIAGGGLLIGTAGVIGRNMGGATGSFGGMLTALAIVWGTMENSGTDVNYSRDNFLFGDPNGQNGGFAGVYDTHIGTPIP